MFWMRIFLCFSMMAAVCLAEPTDEEILERLRPGHPRLVLTNQGLDQLKERINAQPELKKMAENILSKASSLLDVSPVTCDLSDHRGLLLAKSTECVDRMYVLGIAYRLTGNASFADRAKKELLSVCAFPDWNPTHFLDTAEMSHGVGIGYDWFYDSLGKDRDTVRQALIEKGLEQGFGPHNWRKRCNHNWNFVCNGGLVMGALAVMDEWQEGGARTVRDAVTFLPNALKTYSPDGGWNEGPGYWSYATRYLAYCLTAMETALGTDFGLSESEGLDETGDFRIHAIGPTRLYFNFADAHDHCGSASEMYWLSGRFRKPFYARHEWSISGADGVDPWRLLWYDSALLTGESKRVPFDRLFEGTGVAFLRSSWRDPKAVYIGIKGGDNRANHSHLDMGTFVLDALGTRWALDLGRDSYALPGYFLGKRWDYYRLRTEGHNTLVFNGENQQYQAASRFLRFESKPGKRFAILDLTEGYHPHAERVLRGVRLLKGDRVLLQDQIVLPGDTQVVWSMHTRASIELMGRQATLRRDGQTMELLALLPEEAVFEKRSTHTKAPENLNEGVEKLLLRAPRPTERALVFSVLFTPLRPDQQRSSPVRPRPMSQW